MLDTFAEALRLLLVLDPAVAGIAALSLRVSLAAAAIGCAIGIPVGALLAIARFPGRDAAVVVLNALMGLPAVVVGLIVYLA
ncbi:MAG: ABC transporter permease, partial [bacterium]